MRVVPLLSSSVSPALWREHPAVELVLDGSPTEPWIGAVQTGLEVHALHASDHRWQASPAGLIHPLLQPDFLVLPAEAPGDRAATTALLGALEFLLEAAAGRWRVVLRPAPEAVLPLVRLMRDVQAHAVGFCWDPAQGGTLEAYEDRLACAVASPHADLAPLAARGYRWNVALPATTPEAFASDRATLVLPEPAGPAAATPVPDEPLRWGSAWGGQP